MTNNRHPEIHVIMRVQGFMLNPKPQIWLAMLMKMIREEDG